MSTRISDWAPIALFIYKRPQHARRTIGSLLACEGVALSPIHVFADGPKTEAEVPAVLVTRAAARELLGSRAVFVEQDLNRGLANSIISGVTELCDRYGEVIVIEDDLILAPSFLRFLNQALERYRDEPRVMQVSGHMFDVPSIAYQREALLLPLTTSWGWATWKRAWDQFDPYAIGWREILHDESEVKRFNLDGAYEYSRMLERKMNGGVDSWAIAWYYTVFAHSGLVLFPPRSLVSNTGFDGSGTHDRLALPVHQAALETAASFTWPEEVAESRQKAQVFDAIRGFRPSSTRQRLTALTRVVRRPRATR